MDTRAESCPICVPLPAALARAPYLWWVCVLLTSLSGFLLILCFPRFDLTFLAPVALTPLLLACAMEASWWRRLLLGELAGAVYWAGSCYWIKYVLEHHGGMGIIGSWVALVLFATIKALHMSVFALAAGPLMGTFWAIPSVAALWVAIERTHGPLGFAWQALGNAGIDMDLPLRLAPFTGVYGLSFVFVMLSTAVALALLRRPKTHLLWLLSLVLLLFLPTPQSPSPPGATALLVQPVIPEEQSWDGQALQTTLNRVVLLTLQAAMHPDLPSPSLILWPEVPAPFYLEDPSFFNQAVTVARTTRAHFLAGVVAHTPNGEPLNSAVLISPSGDLLGRYDKLFLVPFGEFVPRGFGFINRITQETGDFVPGKRLVLLNAAGHRLGAFICYEAVFPHLVRRFAHAGAEVLLNISNDGYFGPTAARHQHLKIARMRAVENRRWLLRATNNGITAAIDPSGRLVATLPPDRPDTLRSPFACIDATTFYTRHGDWFPLLCALVAALGLAAPLINRGGSAARRRP